MEYHLSHLCIHSLTLAGGPRPTVEQPSRLSNEAWGSLYLSISYRGASERGQQPISNLLHELGVQAVAAVFEQQRLDVASFHTLQ